MNPFALPKGVTHYPHEPRAPEPERQGPRPCENEGTSVGGKPCPNAATHRVTFWEGQDEYESFLCGECFVGFREEMIKIGLRPRNEQPTDTPCNTPEKP